jgi:hypothetical protein
MAGPKAKKVNAREHPSFHAGKEEIFSVEKLYKKKSSRN